MGLEGLAARDARFLGCFALSSVLVLLLDNRTREVDLGADASARGVADDETRVEQRSLILWFCRKLAERAIRLISWFW